jgi:hypothetical protein
MKKSELKQIIKEEIGRVLSESTLAKHFKKGDKVRVTDREGFKQLVGKVGTVIATENAKGIVYVDFGEKINGDGFTTHDFGKLLDTPTGLGFYDRGWFTSKIDPRFDIRNLERI